MNFFHKYIKFFYLIPFIFGISCYFIGSSFEIGFLVICSLILFLLGLGVLSYASWKNVFSIYFNFIHLSSREKFEVKVRLMNDENFREDYELEKSYKRKIYFKPLITSIFLGLGSCILFILLIVSLVWF